MSSEDSGEINDEYERSESQPADESPYANVLPLKNLKHGWSVFSGYLTTAAVQIEAKANEINESEAVKNFKARATEVATPYIEKGAQTWEATKEKATPIVKEVYDRAVEVSSTAIDAAKPTVEKIGENVTAVVQKVSAVASDVTEKVGAEISKLMGEGNAEQSESEAESATESPTDPPSSTFTI